MELREYVDILRNSWVLVVIVALLGLGAGAGASLLTTPEYGSRTQIYVSVRSQSGTSGELFQGANYSRQIVNSYISVIRTGVVLDPVIEKLRLDMTSDELASYVSANSPEDTSLINIVALSPSADQSAQLSNAVGESLKEVVRNQLEPETSAGESPVQLTTTQVAVTPSYPVTPNVKLNLMIGLLLGIIVGYAAAVLRKLLDNRIYSDDEIEEISETPVIGGMVEDSDFGKNNILMRFKPQSPYSESVRALRTNLKYLNVNSANRVFVVTSSNSGEGKTTTSLNLAFALAQAGAKVAVVEGDLRKPMFSSYLGIEGGAGLTDVLIGRAGIDDVIQRWGTEQFYVLAAGRVPPNPSELLGSDAMKSTLKALQEDYDYVIVDAPPVLAVTDAVVLSSYAAGLLMVVAAGSTTKHALRASLRGLETAGASVLGIVLTMISAGKENDYHYHYRFAHVEDSTSTQAAGDQEAEPAKRILGEVHAK